MPSRTSPDNSDSSLAHLPIAIPKIFDQAQLSTANHQKNFVALYKLHAEAAQHIELVYNGRGRKLVGEKAFEDVFHQMLLFVFPQKKGVAQAERVVKFVGGYTKFINEKAAEEIVNDESNDEPEETTASRFTAHLLKFLLKGFAGKDKVVRYRVLQTVAEMVSHLGEIDEEIYTDLRAGLLERVSDKESPVRMQALIALSKLCSAEESSELEDGQSVLDTLVDSLAHDSSADVRKAVLLNIPVSDATLPHILSRTRDIDTTIRKVVYLSVLQPNTTQGDPPVVGPSHPRVLTIDQRELIVRNGLGDREPTVRSAAGALIGAWVENIHLQKLEDNVPRPNEANAEDDKAERNILLLLKLFDLINSTKSTVVTDALLSVFSTKESLLNEIEFGDQYWTNLTPESAFLARVFVDHCKATNDETRLEAALPVVTALAFHIQESYNCLMDSIQNFKDEQLLQVYSEEEKVRKEDDLLDQEFIICEMLKLAVNLDYADEIGRRKMFQLVRDMLSQEILPEGLIPACLDVLRILSVNERDLIRIVVEIVTDVRDRGEEEEIPVKDVDAETNYGDTPATVQRTRSRKPAAELSPEERARADAIDLKCLTLCTGMLERVDSTLDDNSTLHGILQDLVFPSVERKELPFRQKGVVALGLCCLIAPRLATHTITLFIRQIQNSPEELKLAIIKSVFDMIMVHENILRKELKKEGPDLSELINYLVKLLSTDTSEKVLALICTGIAKLVFSGVVLDDTVLQNLILAYLSPRTIDNQELRQCLTYFLPVFSYSSSANQVRMRKIFLPTYNQLNKTRRDLADGQEMVGAAQVVAMFVDWTDPLKLLNAVHATGNNQAGGVVNEAVHLDMAEDIMKALLKPQDFGIDLQNDEKKVLLQVLPKLHIPDKVDDDEIRKLKLVIYYVMQRRPVKDAAAVKAVAKFDSIISEKFAQQLEDFSEEDYKKMEQLKDLFDFLDSIIPEDDEPGEDDVPKKRGRKRRPQSVASASTEADSQLNYSTKEKPRRKAKRRRISGSDEEDDDDQSTPVPSVPTRILPKRASTKKIEVAKIESDEESTIDGPSALVQERPSMPEDDQRSDESELSEPQDSIMDDSEEEEVNGLLTEE